MSNNDEMPKKAEDAVKEFEEIKQQLVVPKKMREKAKYWFSLPPAIIVALLDLVWDVSIATSGQDGDLGSPDKRSNLHGLFWGLQPYFIDSSKLNKFLDSLEAWGANKKKIDSLKQEAEKRRGSLPKQIKWHHLIYAYMIENTRIYEVFRRVIHAYRHDEKLAVPTAEAHAWLRTTEELFYRDPPPFSVATLTSYVRPDLTATRRNAYYRMFGMDLNHGTDDGKAYPYEKAEAANREFVTTFEEFLREVWVGISNKDNKTGMNPTDKAAIRSLAERLYSMLTARRVDGNLSREEFVFVSSMAWFDLTVGDNTDIVVALKAQAKSPEERLFKIAQRVGLPAHSKSEHFFDIAELTSQVLIQIEMGTYNDIDAVEALYKSDEVGGAMREIINGWSQATGHDLKTQKTVAVVAMR